MDLKGKTIVVTGGARGLGYSRSRVFFFLPNAERGISHTPRDAEGRASRTSRRPREPVLRVRAELLGHSRQVRRERESVRGRAERRDRGSRGPSLRGGA